VSYVLSFSLNLARLLEGQAGTASHDQTPLTSFECQIVVNMYTIREWHNVDIYARELLVYGNDMYVIVIISSMTSPF
jgi:hypothetical protein